MRRLLIVLVLLLATAAFSTPAAAQGKSQAPTTIELKAKDGIVLKASYFSAGRPGPALLLFHACNRDRSAWAPFAADAASRGFHVLTLDFRGYGESGDKRRDDPAQQQWIADRFWPADVDAAYAWLVAQPGVDKARIGTAGASCGVNQSVQLARRHPEVKTVVLLSGGVTADSRTFLRDTSSLPILAAASHGDGGIVTTMRWTLGWSRNPSNKFLEYKAAGHGTDMFAVEKDLPSAILSWFESQVRDAPASRPADAPVAKPSEVEVFWTTLNSPGGVPKARELYDRAKRTNKNVVLFPEGEVNQLGYQLLQSGNPKDAMTVFEMNVDAYPTSANTYDSLSDAYLALGNKEEALRYAEKALAALDTDIEATPEFKQLVRGGAERKIKELKK